MDIEKLQGIVIEALEDVKAADIAIYDTSRLTDIFDRLVIASGTSNRQTKALAASVRDKVRELGGSVVGMEGEEAGEWVLVDLGDIVVHIMQPPIRAYYQLEEIWGSKQLDLDKAKEALKKKPVQRKKTGTPKTTATARKKSAPEKVDSAAKTKQVKKETIKKPSATNAVKTASRKTSPSEKTPAKRK